MLVVIVLAARWLVRRFQLRRIDGFLAGGGALLITLCFEFTVVLYLRGMTLSEYFKTRDPISETGYYVTLGLFALMPLLMRTPRLLSVKRKINRKG